jgi:hypothetical protein
MKKILKNLRKGFFSETFYPQKKPLLTKKHCISCSHPVYLEGHIELWILYKLTYIDWYECKKCGVSWGCKK